MPRQHPSPKRDSRKLSLKQQSAIDSHMWTRDGDMKSTRRPGVAIVAVLLTIIAFYFQGLPYLSPGANLLTPLVRSGLRKAFPPESFCTKEIGEGNCCDLYMAAEPCVDECRKSFVDRQTFQLTKEYDVCADKCLVRYRAACMQVAASNKNLETKADEPRTRR
ncbi:hypothetical protein BDV95DRAFT_610675 [Massariosphaeria phaeospora]|uniref:Uncharacterized protein n=1 Tax=Massariosphaeria phaeospora TaxID=100035 RepID=A0A7C8I4F3_9PLEO|nr:hypothetical protein BDV95DRAFT_610675 [Massariosphaeria phaeospora]